MEEKLDSKKRAMFYEHLDELASGARTRTMREVSRWFCDLTYEQLLAFMTDAARDTDLRRAILSFTALREIFYGSNAYRPLMDVRLERLQIEISNYKIAFFDLLRIGVPEDRWNTLARKYFEVLENRLKLGQLIRPEELHHKTAKNEAARIFYQYAKEQGREERMDAVITGSFFFEQLLTVESWIVDPQKRERIEVLTQELKAPIEPPSQELIDLAYSLSREELLGLMIQMTQLEPKLAILGLMGLKKSFSANPSKDSAVDTELAELRAQIAGYWNYLDAFTYSSLSDKDWRFRQDVRPSLMSSERPLKEWVHPAIEFLKGVRAYLEAGQFIENRDFCFEQKRRIFEKRREELILQGHVELQSFSQGPARPPAHKMSEALSREANIDSSLFENFIELTRRPETNDASEIYAVVGKLAYGELLALLIELTHQDLRLCFKSMELLRRAFRFSPKQPVEDDRVNELRRQIVDHNSLFKYFVDTDAPEVLWKELGLEYQLLLRERLNRFGYIVQGCSVRWGHLFNECALLMRDLTLQDYKGLKIVRD